MADLFEGEFIKNAKADLSKALNQPEQSDFTIKHLAQDANGFELAKQAMIEGCPLELAVSRIVLELQKDKEPGSYYHAWQRNIAICFYDLIRERTPGIARVHDIHGLANKAAQNFLDVLCLTNDGNKQEPPKQSESPE